jgi:hypothetical protein
VLYGGSELFDVRFYQFFVEYNTNKDRMHLIDAEARGLNLLFNKILHDTLQYTIVS